MNIGYVILFILLCVLVFLLWVSWTMVIGAPWVPTPMHKVRNMLELAEVNTEDIVFDLGSGDGRIIIMAAEEFGAQSVGIEIDYLRTKLSRFTIRRKGLTHTVKVIRANFFKIDFGEATVVTLYQGVGVNNKLREKLLRDLKPGTRVVSHNFTFKGWQPVKTNTDASNYLYIMQ